MKNQLKILMIKKLAIAVLTFTVSFAAIDYFLNILLPPRCTVNQFDDKLGHSLIPNKSCSVTTDEYRVNYSINSLGFRDNEIALQKPKNTIRILFLGDSFTLGYGVKLKDTFVKNVGLLLESDIHDERFETVNTGVAAYTTLNEYLMLKYKGINLNPDLVILNINSTDFIEQRSLLRAIVIKKDGTISFEKLARKKYLPEKVDSYLLDHSYSYNQLVENQEKLVNMKNKVIEWFTGNRRVAKSDKPDPFAVTKSMPSDQFNQLVDPVLSQVLEIKKFLDQYQIPLVITYIPHGHQIDSTQWTRGRLEMNLTDQVYPDNLQQRLQGFAKDNSILFLDLTPGFKKFVKNNPGEKLYFDYDGHFNSLGQRLAARIISDFLIENKVNLFARQ